MKPRSIAAGAATLALAAVLAGVPAARAQAQNTNDQGAAASGQASGAAAPADQPTAQNGETTGALQEVVVTAERRATNVQATPIAVTALEGNQMQTLHLNDISDMQNTVPGFQSADEAGFFNSINIRGMGNTAITPTIATGVLVFRDGIPMWETIAEDEPYFDIADTEVLEGPQGTFVGASSTAGAVEINSANPNFNGLNGYVLAGLGNYTDTKYQGALNLPVSDTFAVRFAFNNEQRNSFYDDIAATNGGYYFNQYSPTFGTRLPLDQGPPGQAYSITDPGNLDGRQFRVKLLWKPTDNFQALGDWEYSYIQTDGEPAEPNPYTYNSLFSIGTGYSACTGVAPGAQVTCSKAGASSHSSYYYPGEQPFVLDYYGNGMEEDELLEHYSLDLRDTLADGIVIRSLTGYVRIDINHEANESYGPEDVGWEYHEIGPHDDYDSEEINIISPTTGKTNWIVGGFWAYRDTPVMTNVYTVPESEQWQPGAAPTTESYGASSTVNRIAAVFGQFNWQFTNTLQLQLGVRENWDNNFVYNEVGVAPKPGTVLQSPQGTGLYAINSTADGGAAACTTAGFVSPCYTVRTDVPAKGAYADVVPTGKIDLNWVPLTGQNFYLFYARGYLAGGANSSSEDHTTFSPEHVNDFELGWKGRLLNGHILTQVGGYYTIFQNMQYPLEDLEAADDTSIGSYTANLATTKIYGLTISEQSRFAGLGVNVGFDYNHSALGAIRTLPAYALPVGWGSPTAIPQCVAGHTYTTTPGCFNYNPYLVNLSGEANPFAPQYTGNLTVDYLFPVGIGTLDPRVTYSYTSHQYASIFEIPYNEMGARHLVDASADWVVNKWDVQLWGKNLTNQIYVIDGGNPLYYGAPRQVGFQGTYTF